MPAGGGRPERGRVGGRGVVSSGRERSHGGRVGRGGRLRRRRRARQRAGRLLHACMPGAVVGTSHARGKNSVGGGCVQPLFKRPTLQA